MITEGVKDQILTGISFGMKKEDMFILCELTPAEIDELSKDAFFAARANAKEKETTYDLLRSLNDVIDIQVMKGKDHAITWLLEKLDPRFKANADTTDRPGIVNITTQNLKLENSDTVNIQTYDDTLIAPGSEDSEEGK